MTASAAIAEATGREILCDLPGGALRLMTVDRLARYLDRDVLLRDDEASEPPYWAHLWPAARSLARLLAANGSRLVGRRVIELGCGLGLPGLVAAQQGAAVLVTDRNLDALAFARRSAILNGLQLSVLAMDWRQGSVSGEFDLCLAADVTYDPTTHDALIDFLDRHLSLEDGEVWIAESVRAEETRLPDRLRQRFAVSEQRTTEIEEGHRVWVRVLSGRRKR